MADERKRRKRKEIVFAFDGEVNVEDIVAMRRANDEWPIKFEPPPRGDKACYGLALLLFNLEGDLTPAALAVLGVLIDHANPKTGQCNPSVTRIAKGINRHRRTVFRAIAVAAARRTKLPPDANFWAYCRSNA